MRIQVIIKMGILACLLFTAVVPVSSKAMDDAAPAVCTEVKTDSGNVIGVHQKKTGLCEYLGIPYAEPPVGELRFALPRPPQAWEGAREMNKFGAECLQYPLVIFKTPELAGSEDCLYLNVWQPAESFTSPKPVMVFIHGGGYEFGSGSFPLYNGERLASGADVVVVNFNYRLGPIGSFVHPAFRGPEGDIANFGLHDQLLALKWVKKNIAAFGGDPDNITIFGESAGGTSMGVALVSPSFEGLYNKVIVESGAMMLIGETIDASAENGLRMAADLGCGDPVSAADCLRNIDAAEFYKYSVPMFSKATEGLTKKETDGSSKEDAGEVKEEPKSKYSFAPVTGDRLMPDTILRLLPEKKLPEGLKVIIGYNRDEATLFSIGVKIQSPEEYAKVLRENVLEVTSRFSIEVSVDDILAQYPAEDYPDPKSAYIELLTDTIFACPSILSANALSSLGADTYFYVFSKPPTNLKMVEKLGAFHASELPFVFGNFKLFGFSFRSTENIALSNQMISMWGSFARDGKPVADGVPAWPLYTAAGGEYLDINIQSATGEKLKVDNCAFFADLIREHLE